MTTEIMTGKFIYVFNEDAKNKLLSGGYKLLKTDESQKIYIFENSDRLTFSQTDFLFILSDTLTF